MACLSDRIVASNVSEQVPSSAPSMTAMPPDALISSFFARVIAIPTVAEDDCTIRVTTAPIADPRKGLSSLVIHTRKSACSLKGSTARSIVYSPKKRIPKNKTTRPVCEIFSLFAKKLNLKLFSPCPF